MNKKQQRELENKIREAMEEPADLTEDEIADIRNRAYWAYQKKMADEKQSSKSRKKKSGFLRRVVAVFAIAVGLIVMSVVYSVLEPVTVGNANSFVRRAAIWVNDQLHLGISFPVPMYEQNDTEDLNFISFSSIQEAANTLNMPIVYVNSEIGQSFIGVEATKFDEASWTVRVKYKYGSEDFIVMIEEILDDQITDVSNDNIKQIESPIGEIIYWNKEGINRAIAFFNGYTIELFGSVSESFFLKCCDSLSIIN